MDLARKLDWEPTYVSEAELYPPELSGRPWLPHEAWASWDEPFRTTYADYVAGQDRKEVDLAAVRDSVGARVATDAWSSAVKLHAATLPHAEFAAVVGNLRGARFGRDSAWRNTSLLGALDEMRHAQIPLLLLHPQVRHDVQLDWTCRLYHSNDWVAIAARHLVDELLIGADAIEFAIATHFVFETGFTNLQFVALASLARAVEDRLFEKMLGTIQSDEARHAQVGSPVLAVVAAHDRAYAQRLLDKWFWRSWLLFSIVTGFAMDYFTPLEQRTASFGEFVDEWVIGQYARHLEELGLERPWYWEHFLESVRYYHHMVYASAYTYRASVWFDFVVPGPRERAWLSEKYPGSWAEVDPVWDRITARWAATTVGNDFAVHGTAIPAFCDLCQLVLCGGTPQKNSAQALTFSGRNYIFCSTPCRWIFEQEPERYARHLGVVGRVLAGQAPANLVAMLRQYFGLDHSDWGKDVARGVYPFVHRGGAT